MFQLRKFEIHFLITLDQTVRNLFLNVLYIKGFVLYKIKTNKSK